MEEENSVHSEITAELFTAPIFAKWPNFCIAGAGKGIATREGIMKTVFFTLTALTTTFVLFPAAIAGESLVVLPHVSEPASMLIFGIGLFLLAKIAQN
jgi:hypothetical protein